MRYFKFSVLKEYSIFFWLLLIVILGLSISSIYSNIKTEKKSKFNSTLDNTYLKKSIIELTNNLKPRYTIFEYLAKSGDTIQSVINKLKIIVRRYFFIIIFYTKLFKKKLYFFVIFVT